MTPPVARPLPKVCCRAGCQAREINPLPKSPEMRPTAGVRFRWSSYEDHGANQRVFHPCTESVLAGTAITELLMMNTRHAELDGIFNHPLIEGGTQTFTEPGQPAAPLMRAVANVLDCRVCPNAECGAPAKPVLYVPVSIRTRLYGLLNDFRRRRKHYQEPKELHHLDLLHLPAG